MVGSIDLRTLDRHPGASISSLIPSLSCRRCSPNPPFARLEMLTAERLMALRRRMRRTAIRNAFVALVIALILFGTWKLIALAVAIK
jgi:hypothetical protein